MADQSMEREQSIQAGQLIQAVDGEESTHKGRITLAMYKFKVKAEHTQQTLDL